MAALVVGCGGHTSSSSKGSLAPGLTLTTQRLANAQQGSPYAATLVATSGRAPYTFQLGAGSSLPAGLALQGDSISGTPTVSGDFTFEVVVTDTPPSLSAPISVTTTVSLHVSSNLAVATTSIPNTEVGSAYSASLVAAGGVPPYRWQVVQGALPAGLALAGDTISGTVGAMGSFSITVEVTDSIGTSVSAPLTLTSANHPDGSVAATNAMAVARAGHAAVLLNNGKVLITGGWSQLTSPTSGDPVNSAELYDPATGTFTLLQSTMSVPRAFHEAVLLETGDVLINGGEQQNSLMAPYAPAGTVAEPELFDVQTQTFRTYTSLVGPAGLSGQPELRYMGTTTVLDYTTAGSYSIRNVGGSDPSGVRTLHVERVFYNGTDEFWMYLSLLFFPDNLDLERHVALALPRLPTQTVGNLLTVGGGPNANLTCTEWVPFSYAFLRRDDVDTGGSPERKDHSANALSPTRILIVGGVDARAPAGSPALGSAVVYDFSTLPAQFNPTSGAPLACSNHTSTTLATGRVLVTGGVDGQTPPQPQATAQLYVPASDSFVNAGTPLSTSRTWHTATLLGNGTVLVTGGAAQLAAGTSLSSADLYTP